MRIEPITIRIDMNSLSPDEMIVVAGILQRSKQVPTQPTQETSSPTEKKEPSRKIKKGRRMKRFESKDMKEVIKALRKDEAPLEIAERFGCSPQAIYRFKQILNKDPRYVVTESFAKALKELDEEEKKEPIEERDPYM